jgi:hypothetical protein
VRRYVHVYHGGVPLIDKILEMVSNEHLHLVQGQRRCHGCATKISETAKVMSIRPEFIIVFVPALGINLPSFPSARCDEYRFANIFPTFGLVRDKRRRHHRGRSQIDFTVPPMPMSERIS